MVKELFPALNPNQTAANEEETTQVVVSKTVRTGETPQTTTRGEDPSEATDEDDKKQHPRPPENSFYPLFSTTMQDKICYNCGKRGHVSKYCSTKSNLCMEMDSLNESDLHHFSQDEYFGYDDQMGQTSGEKGDTYVVDKLTEYFGDLEPHGKGEKTKTKGELKAFTETVLAFPVSIRLDSLPNHQR